VQETQATQLSDSQLQDAQPRDEDSPEDSAGNGKDSAEEPAQEPAEEPAEAPSKRVQRGSRKPTPKQGPVVIPYSKRQQKLLSIIEDDSNAQIVPVDKKPKHDNGPQKTPKADATLRDRAKATMFFKLQTSNLLPEFINKLWAEAAKNPEGRRMLR